jgi:beta-glucosidase
MPCYNELSGIPAHVNEWLLTRLLREEWGFKGTIVSDYFALGDLISLHKVAKNDVEAAQSSVWAGVDVETPNIAKYKTLSEQVKAGKVTISSIDAAVKRILTTKFNLELFENPYTDPEAAKRVIGSDAHRQIALRAAQEAMVLLKNEGNLLPLQKGKYKRIAIVGPNADRCILGGYADKPKQCITPLQALRAKMGSDVEFIYAEGVRLTDSGDWFSDNDKTKPTNRTDNLPRMQEAIEKCQKADVILYFGGANEAIFREGWGTNHFGDLPSIDLFGDQNELILELKKLNKPMAGFVFSGPPLACNVLNDNVLSLVHCGYLGQETGDAVADLILGKVNPSGKLSMTIPRSVGHIPAYYAYKPSARRGLMFGDVSPLYPFGHGLSYTQFKFSAPTVSATQITKNQHVTVRVSVTNVGNQDGAEVVQLYLRDVVSSVTRPVKELKDFKKITLKAGETQTVNFVITPDKLSFYDRSMKKVVEAGAFEIMVGNSSENVQKISFEVTEK